MQVVDMIKIIVSICCFIIGAIIFLYIQKDVIERKKYAHYNLITVYAQYVFYYLCCASIIFSIVFLFIK